MKPAAIAIALLFAIAAAPASAALAQSPTITLTLRNHQFIPAEVPVPAGGKAEIVVRNEQPTPAEFESTSLHREKVVTPGSQISVYVGPLDPGRYEFFDDFNPSARGFVVVK